MACKWRSLAWRFGAPCVLGWPLWLSAAGDPLAEARALLESGRLHQAAARLQALPGENAEVALLQARIALQLGRLDEADTALQAAARAGASRGVQALRAELAQRRGEPERARAQWQALAQDAAEPLPVRQRALLEAAALEGAAARLASLRALEPGLTDPALLLRLAELAQAADLPLAERALLRVQGTPLQRAQALQARAALAEAAGPARRDEAARLNAEALALIAPLPDAQQAELRVLLDWRAARLQPGTPAALASLQRAVAQLEAVRDDWPLAAADGRSTHQSLFQPLYLQLADALLRRADASRGEERQAWLRRTRDALEQLYQAELQDYLGDRCEVDAVKGAGGAGALPPGSAAVYPLLLADRVALLVEDAQGLDSFQSKAEPGAVRDTARLLAQRLRDRAPGYLSAARSLHDALVQPMAPWLAARGTHTLVWVNDGVLRLVPMAVLYDGEQHLLERFQTANVLGISMTNLQGGSGGRVQALVAGAGRFGPVVERLASETWAQPLRRQLLGPAAEAEPGADPRATRSLQAQRLREALELPGVAEEVKTLQKLLPGPVLQDTGFTVQGFSGQVQKGGHRVVHIASHGVFGGSAATSFLMAYDDLLTLPNLQNLLQSESTRRQPIELLTLSACQTAEGNERAPLGLSGAALKARARSVLGTLWPVDDAATVQLMSAFYGGWTAQPGAGKAAALREAQRALLRQADTRHPYYWAPFALIGNWQ